LSLNSVYAFGGQYQLKIKQICHSMWLPSRRSNKKCIWLTSIVLGLWGIWSQNNPEKDFSINFIHLYMQLNDLQNKSPQGWSLRIIIPGIIVWKHICSHPWRSRFSSLVILSENSFIDNSM
jgi:hypothetical protein